MRRTQAIDSLVIQALRVMVLAAGRGSIPAMPAPAAQEFVFDAEQLDSADALPVENLDVETLRQIVHEPSGVKI